MLDDFRLNVFIAVAHEKSFTKAAAHLRISQPAVSQHISELEKQLGVKLFQRQGGIVSLTPAGLVFKGYAERILSDYSKVQAMFSELPEMIVGVSASEEVYDYIMRDILADFITVHPQVTFVKTFPDNADLCVHLLPFAQGTFKIAAIPSDKFSRSRVWEVMSVFFNQE